MNRVRSVAGMLRVGAIVVAGALVVSACGDSSGSETNVSTPGAAVSGSAGAPTGTPFVIGAIGSQTGQIAASTNQGFTVAPAWADWVNANGGINGQPVQLEVADDGFDPAKAQAAVKDLIDNKKVDALLVISDQMLSSYVQDAASKGIPVIGAQENSTVWYTQAGTYTTGTDIQSLVGGIVQTAKDYGKATKFGYVYCTEVAACAESVPLVQAAAEKAGIGFTSLGASGTSPDFTAECLKLQQEGVDVVFSGAGTTPAVAKFVQDCQAQGYNPTFGTASNGLGPELLALTDFTAYGPAFDFLSVADAPVVKTFAGAMKQYAMDDNWQNGTGEGTWAALEMLRKALGTSSGDVTPASITAALNTVKDENLGGLLANKVTYTGQPLAYGSRPCYFVVSVKDGKVQAPAGLDPQCPA